MDEDIVVQRQTSVGEAGHRIIDIHTHFMPLNMPDFAAEHGDPRWPVLVVEGSGTGVISRGPHVFRVVDRCCFEVDARIRRMDECGIDIQVVSPVPVTLVPWADGDLAAAYCRHQNDALAEVQRNSRGRILAFGAVPLQAPDLAIIEMERVITQLNMRGVEIGASVSGGDLDSVALRAFFASAAELGARLLVHPLEGGNLIMPGKSSLTAFGVGMLTDTTLAATALVFGGVLEQFPNLKVVLSHGGGSFSSCYPRLRFRYALDDAQPEAISAVVDERARLLFVDSIVFDPHLMRVLKHRFGADHVLYGSDFPFKSWDPPGDSDIFSTAVADGIISPEECVGMRGTNALAFLGL